MKVHLVDPVEPGAELFAFPGGPGSVVAFHIDFFYHHVPFLLGLD